MTINIRFLSIVLLFGIVALVGAAETGTAKTYPPKMDGAQVETYKTIAGTELKLWIFSPPSAPKSAPAIVFFFGGGWSTGSPQQFEAQCRHFASRGMVAIAADYRVKSRQAAKPVQCIADARSAVRWVRANATRLGIDPQRIAAAGGSAGGHLAASTAFISTFDEANEDKAISAVPNALVLFNPGLVMAPLNGLFLEGFGTGLSEKHLGGQPEQISPAHHVGKDAPPTIIFHGRADTTIPYASAEAFTKVMVDAGARCELVGFDSQPHGFFNKEPFKRQTQAAADAFLVSLGWLPAINKK
jgi:acetyl esterase/lipase